MSVPAGNLKQGIVKQVLSGDTVVVRGWPRGGLPPVKTISFNGVSAPKIARFIKGKDESEDEPWAWEAREYLRKRLVGKQVYFSIEKLNTNASTGTSTREYGAVYLGNDPTKDENITETLVSEGLARVRSDNKTLIEIQDKAKAQNKGIWGTDNQQKHIRNVSWSVSDNQLIFKKFGGKFIPAIIEHVRDGSTVRAFLLPPDEEVFYYVTVMLTGIRAPSMIKENNDKYAIAVEGQYFVEGMILQQEVEILIEYADTTNVRGSVFRKKVNIAESILMEGFAQCLDITMGYLTSGAANLRAAERKAKEKKLRLWANWESNAPAIPQKDKEFQATVTEVVNGDAFMVKQANGNMKKIFLSSIRPPREKVANDEDGKPIQKPRGDKRPLYDVPWMFEAREFLRKKLIGKKVSVIVDYIQPARETLPEKTCCTILIAGANVGEALISEGLATVFTHGHNDDQRSSQYDKLFEAEQKAKKAQVGLHAKKDVPNHKVIDVSHDSAMAKKFLPHLLRAQKKEALVEFVASGSRMRLFISKDSWLITFSLGGINCPRASRPSINNAPPQKGEPYGDEALQYTKERCLQREVQINVESSDRLGNFFGWLWIDGLNLSVGLIKEGLASVHPSAERSEHYRDLKNAEDAAKKDKLGIWKDYVEVKKEEFVEDDKVHERKINYEKVFITEVTSEGHFFAQNTEQGPKLENLMERLRQEFVTNPPLTGEYTPRKGDLCTAKFSADDQWYRAKVEKVQAANISVLYIDYGNREIINITRCARLPDAFKEKPYAVEYSLACVLFPQDEEYREDAIRTLKEDILNKILLLNVEDKSTITAVTLTNPTNNKDIARELIFDGLLMVEKRRERRFAKLINEYKSVQEDAKKSHVNIWQYGDITEDDAKEFGIGH